MYFLLTTLKIPPPNVISPIFVCNFVSLWAPPMILLTAGALTDPQLPARASNDTTDARLGGIGLVPSSGLHRPGGIDRVASICVCERFVLPQGNLAPNVFRFTVHV